MDDSSKYYTDLDNLSNTIEKYGVAIIPNLFDENECLKMISEMWDYLEYITQEWETPMDRNNKSTWELLNNLTSKSLLFQYWNIGHSQMSWNLRQNPKIVEIFAKFWNVKSEDLLTSFDGSSFELEQVSDVKSHYIEWYHVDHSYLDPNFRNLQAWITAYDVNEGDATLKILESSHKLFQEVGNKFNIRNDKNWHLLNEEEFKYYSDRCPQKSISCPKGSIVLWDSRTVHYGAISTNKKNIRCITYLCYAPRNLCSTYNLKLKKYAFNNLLTTSHDPIDFGFKPRTPFKEEYDESYFITKITRPILTPLGEKLAGLI